jgi:hypothetical protein
MPANAGKLLRIIADNIATPICHIFNLSLLESVFHQAWREDKVIPLPKNSKTSLAGSNTRLISLLPTLSKLLEKNMFVQIQCYFTVNKLTTYFQHTYRKGLSTCTALTQMTDDMLREIEDQIIVGAVLLDFSAAFDIIDHRLPLEKRMRYAFTPPAIMWIRVTCLTEHRGCSLVEASQT